MLSFHETYEINKKGLNQHKNNKTFCKTCFKLIKTLCNSPKFDDTKNLRVRVNG